MDSWNRLGAARRGGAAAPVIVAVAIGLSASIARAEMVLDWELDSSFAPLAAGQIVDDEFAAFGVHVSAGNAVAGHPDLAVIFDSANPTGGDTDLATPGYHATNVSAFGNILIIAEDGQDNGFGMLTTAPDDEAGGGFLRFDLDFTAVELSLAMLDIEEGGGSIDFYRAGNLVGSVELPALADNSVQFVGFGGPEFDAFQVNLAGSGAVAEVTLQAVPAPAAAALLALGALRRRRRRD